MRLPSPARREPPRRSYRAGCGPAPAGTGAPGRRRRGAPAGVQASAVLPGTANRGGITPVIVYASPSRARVRPSTPGSPPNPRCQIPCAMTTARGSPPAGKVCPRRGATPSSPNVPAVTRETRSCVGSAPPVQAIGCARSNAATASRLRLCAAQSRASGEETENCGRPRSGCADHTRRRRSGDA